MIPSPRQATEIGPPRGKYGSISGYDRGVAFARVGTDSGWSQVACTSKYTRGQSHNLEQAEAHARTHKSEPRRIKLLKDETALTTR